MQVLSEKKAIHIHVDNSADKQLLFPGRMDAIARAVKLWANEHEWLY